jgi:hypothetical protein
MDGDNSQRFAGRRRWYNPLCFIGIKQQQSIHVSRGPETSVSASRTETSSSGEECNERD